MCVGLTTNVRLQQYHITNESKHAQQFPVVSCPSSYKFSILSYYLSIICACSCSLCFYLLFLGVGIAPFTLASLHPSGVYSNHMASRRRLAGEMRLPENCRNDAASWKLKYGLFICILSVFIKLSLKYLFNFLRCTNALSN